MTARLHRVGARLRDARGYTLIELITSLSMLVVVLTAVSSLFVSATKSQADVTNRFEAQQNARLALDRFRKEAHCATGTTQAAGAQYSTVTLKMSSRCTLASNVSYCIDPAGVTNRAKLYRQLGDTCSPATALRIADYLVSTASSASGFTPVAPTTSSLGTVKVEFYVNVNPAKTFESYNLVDTIVFRNSSRA